MIKANELRIGNWVKDQHERALTVYEIKISGARCLYNGLQNTEHEGIRNSLFSYDYILPIPLTPEILEKCGFEKYSSDIDCSIYGNHSDDSDLFLQFDWRYRDRGYTPMIKSEEWEIIGMNIKYLHQLQNLYFALTGEELNIQL